MTFADISNDQLTTVVLVLLAVALIVWLFGRRR